MFNLVCHNRPRRACKPRQHCRVISGPSRDMKDLLPLLHIERHKTNCVKNRLAVVDSAFGRKSHDDVLIQECRVVARSLEVIAPANTFHGPGPTKRSLGVDANASLSRSFFAAPALAVTNSA